MIEDSDRSTPQAAERARAAADLEDITRLKKFPSFAYFTRRIREEIEKTKEKILDPTTKDDQLHDLKVEHKTLNDVSRLLDVDESGCRSVLSIAPTEEEDEQA